MLKQVAEYNDLSPELLKKLNERIKSFGTSVRYRFNIEQENPDRTFYNGKTIFPGIYTLDPTVFDITDKDETREGKSPFKKVALIKSHESNGTGGFKTEFIKIRVPAPARGILKLELNNPDDIAMCMVLEMHPKLNGGMFEDKNRNRVISRVDDVAEATNQSQERTQRRLALNAVADMQTADLISFADAMQWDSTQDPIILRNMAEDLAETEPKFMNDLISDKTFEIRAVLKQAIDRSIISYNPGAFQFSWTGTNQPLAQVAPTGEEHELIKLSQWVSVGGAKAEEAYNKIKKLVAEAKKPVTA